MQSYTINAQTVYVVFNHQNIRMLLRSIRTKYQPIFLLSVVFCRVVWIVALILGFW